MGGRVGGAVGGQAGGAAVSAGGGLVIGFAIDFARVGFVPSEGNTERTVDRNAVSMWFATQFAVELRSGFQAITVMFSGQQ